MPNWCRNAIRIPADAAARVFDYDADAHTIDFRFERVMPMPPSLMVASGGGENRALELAEALEELRGSDPAAGVMDLPAELRERAQGALPIVHPSFGEYCDEYEAMFADGHITDLEGMARLGSLYLANRREHGAADWYDWRLSHWGTKWDTDEVAVEPDLAAGGNSVIMRFDTAWSPVSGELYGAICDAVGEEIRYEVTYEDDGHTEVWALYREGQVPLAAIEAELIAPTPKALLMCSVDTRHAIEQARRGRPTEIRAVSFDDAYSPTEPVIWETDLGCFGGEVTGWLGRDGTMHVAPFSGPEVVLNDDSQRLLAGLPELREVDLTGCDLTTCEPDMTGLLADCPSLERVRLRPEQAAAIADAVREGRAEGMLAGCDRLDVAEALGGFHTPYVEATLRRAPARRHDAGPRR